MTHVIRSGATIGFQADSYVEEFWLTLITWGGLSSGEHYSPVFGENLASLARIAAARPRDRGQRI